MVWANPSISPADAGTVGADIPPGPDVLELRPRRGWQTINLAELWRYRELIGFLALRDVKVRYKQSVLGVLWAVIQPLSMMVVLGVVLRMLGQQRDPIFLYSGLLPWTFFAAAVVAATNSLVTNAAMLRKVYFPRLAAPLAAIGAPLVDYAVAFLVLLGMMAWSGVAPGWQMLLLPPLVLTTLVAALGVGVLMSGLTVAYRDFRFVVPFVVQLGFFVTPVMYPAREAPWLMHLNPMSGTIAAFRAAVLGQAIDWTAWGISAAAAGVCLLVGLLYFARTERRYADLV